MAPTIQELAVVVQQMKLAKHNCFYHLAWQRDVATIVRAHVSLSMGDVVSISKDVMQTLAYNVL